METMVSEDSDAAYADIVLDYVRTHRPRAGRELAHFRNLQTDEDAISNAALAQLPSGKRHPHQYRIPRSALEQSRNRLLANLDRLRASDSFDDLIELVGRISGPIPGIGRLAIYDTSLRVGARFGLEPKEVYLHAGTRDGVKALGLDSTREAIQMSELPEPMQVLSAREAEDFLCIYKGKLRRR